MKRRFLLYHFVSMLMLTAVLQKAGAGLYLHSRLHTTEKSSKKSEDNKEQKTVSCSCIDDFLSPYEEPVASFPLASVPVHNIFNEFPDQIRFHLPVFFSLLRGPPAC